MQIPQLHEHTHTPHSHSSHLSESATVFFIKSIIFKITQEVQTPPNRNKKESLKMETATFPNVYQTFGFTLLTTPVWMPSYTWG